MTDILTSEEQEQDVKAVLERARLERLRTWLWRCAPIWAGGDVIKFTVQPSGNRMLTLRDFASPVDCVVDWGDGTKDAVTSNTAVSHTYADGTSRTVEISGALGGFWTGWIPADGSDFVVSVDRISSQSLVSLKNTFREMPSLKTIPSRIDAPNLRNCDMAFLGFNNYACPLPPLWKTNPKASHKAAFTKNYWDKYGTACTHFFPKETTLYAYMTAIKGKSVYSEITCSGYPTGRCSRNSNRTCSAATCKSLGYTVKNLGWVPCGHTPMRSCYQMPSLSADSYITYDGDCPLPNEDVAHPSWAEARAAGWL